MRYIRVEWKHEFPEEPVVLYSEVSDAGWEIRKVEEFRDGSVGFACESHSRGSTQLSETPIPDLQEIASDPQFDPAQISREDFEEVWQRAQIDHE